MNDVEKTKTQLLEEIKALRHEAEELRRLEQQSSKLVQEHNLLRQVIDYLPDYIYIKDRAGRFILVNDAIVRGMGAADQSELIGKTDFEFYPLDLAQRYRADEASVLQSGHELTNREELVPNLITGEQHWVLTTKVPLNDPRQGVIGIVGISRDITERRQAEAALRESEQRYRAVVEDQTELISRISPSFITTFANEACCRFLGKTQTQIIGSSIWLDIPVEEQAHVQAVFAGLTPEHPVVTSENRNLSANNDLRWVQWTNRAIYDAQDKLIGYQAVGRDITERKQMEQALRESEQSYRGVVQDQTDLVSRFTPDYTLTFVNDAYQQCFAPSGKNLIGTKMLAPIPLDDRERVQSLLAALSQSSPMATMENRDILPNGEVRWVQWKDRALFDEKGTLVGYQSVGRDITEWKQAEAALRESEEKYRTLFESAREGILISGANGKLIAVNPAAAAMLGYNTPDDMIGMPAAELLYAGPRSRAELFARLNEQGYVEEYEVELKKQDGIPVQILSSVIIQRDTDQNILRTEAIITDITDRKRTEQELQRYRDHLEELIKERTAQLEAVNRELDAFAYSVSHDLRAPIRALNNYSLFLQEDCANHLNEECQAYVQGIAESAQHMETLVVDLLEYSRINRVKVITTQVDITQLLDSLAARYHLKEHAMLKLPTDAPTIVGKITRLEQIFGNLLTNALKFQRPGSTPEIIVSWADQGTEWQFSVQDNGIGIDGKHFEKIFGIFERLHTQEEFEGTGIGLAIVEKAVKEHGGRIWITSQPNQGCTFTFTIPKDIQED